VVKLTARKIKWIIREKTKGILSTNDIALLQNVDESRIRQIWCHYKNAKTIPTLRSKLPLNVGCQNTASQIQGDENAVAQTAQQTFP
jgi:hypothetical protein